MSARPRARAAPMIVMTVPMQFHRPNIAVGSNLRGFLCLGCMIGYFNLEQLAYDYVSTAAELAGEPPYVGEDADRCLTLLRDRLSLVLLPVSPSGV